jgi:hypothetical protein
VLGSLIGPNNDGRSLYALSRLRRQTELVYRYLAGFKGRARGLDRNRWDDGRYAE